VTIETTIKVVLIMLTLVEWEGHVIDVKGEFLKGKFTMNKRCNFKFHKALRLTMKKEWY
jgi:hypothetical protein